MTSDTAHQPAPAPPDRSPSAAPPILAARDVYKTYRMGRVLVPVLRGTSVALNRGEWLAVLGASGSGKSTLLHLLGGLDRPDKSVRAETTCSACRYDLAGLTDDRCPECGKPFTREEIPSGGSIEHEGRDVSSFSPGELDRYRSSAVGFVFQFYHLLPELNVLQNVMIGAMIGRAGSGANARARALLDSFGLGHRLRHRPREISGGERQRVAIARALINDPPILLADEPTGNLDRKTGQSILDAIAEHRAESGLAVVMVTHDPRIAERADRVVTLVDGRAAEEAAPA